MSHKIFCLIPLHVVAFIGFTRLPSYLEPFRDVSQEQAFSSDSFCPNIHIFPPKSDSTLRLTFPQNELWLRWSDGQVGVLECIGGIQYEIKNAKGRILAVSSVRWSVLGALPWLPYGADGTITPFHHLLNSIIFIRNIIIIIISNIIIINNKIISQSQYEYCDLKEGGIIDVKSCSSKSAGVNRDLSGHLVWWIAHQYQQCLKPRPISTMECQSGPPSISISLTRHSSISDCRRTTGELIQLADVLRAVIVSCHPILTLRNICQQWLGESSEKCF